MRIWPYRSKLTPFGDIRYTRTGKQQMADGDGEEALLRLWLVKAQRVTKRLFFRTPGLGSWVWEELGLPLWLEVGPHGAR